MSLTSHLEDKTSPVRRHLEFVAATVADPGPFKEPVTRMLGLADLPKGCVVSPLAGANAGTVGAAFDYRLRYHLAPCQARDFVAALALPLCEDRTIRARIDQFFTDLDQLAARLAPAGKHLGDDDERLLDRYCIVLGLLEAVRRAGPRYLPDHSVGDLLQLAPESAVADLMNLSRSAELYFRPLIEVVTSNAAPYLPNPIFAGSRDVGGADADMLIGDTLLELKVAKGMPPAAVRKALVQLIGYALLDYDDYYGIRNVSVYFPRQEFMRTWPLWVLVFPLAYVVRSTKEPSESEVRARLAKIRGMMRRATAGEALDYEAEFGA